MPHKMKATIFPPGFIFETPSDVTNKARETLFYWLHLLLVKTNIHPQSLYFDMNIPYVTIPIIKGHIPEELVWYVWALSAIHSCAIAFPLYPIYHILCNPLHTNTPLANLFKMFAPLHFWRSRFTRLLSEHNVWTAPDHKKKKFFYVFSLWNDYELISGGELYVNSYTNLWKTHPNWPRDEKRLMKELGAHLTELNEPDMEQIYRSLPLGPFPSSPHISQASSSSSSALQEFQSNFILSGITPSSQQYDPQNPLFQDAQDPYQLETQFQEWASAQPTGSCSQQSPFPIPGPYTSGMYQSDESNSDPNMDPDHEPICKDD